MTLVNVQRVKVQASILLKSISDRYRSDRKLVGPITVQYRFKQNICRNSRTTGTNPHQSVPSVTSQHVASSQTGTSVEMYRII